jgi:DNA mismatch repair protein MutS
MQQYFDIRQHHPDTILMFQVGDFFELFFEDAITVSSFLSIALTKRGKSDGKDIPLCGVPIHAARHYLTKLVKGGFKVALCEQTSKPQPGKVVDRAVTQVFTPGTLTDDQMMDEKSASYLLSFYPGADRWGMVFVELLTAQMFATDLGVLEEKAVESELFRFMPDEIVINNSKSYEKFFKYFSRLGFSVSPADKNISGFKQQDEVDIEVPTLWLEKQMQPQTILKLQECSCLQNCLHTLYWYFLKNHKNALDQLKSIQFYKPEDYLILDSSTQKNLEITKNLNGGGRKNTLLSVLDKAVTPMGSRTIKKWLQRPLVQKEAIIARQQTVVEIKKQIDLMQQFEKIMSSICDVERIVGRIALSRAKVQDFLALKIALAVAPEIKNLIVIKLSGLTLAQTIYQKINDFRGLFDLLDCALEDDISKTWIIKKGFDFKFDRLQELVTDSQKAVLDLEGKEIAATKINSLKIRYNNISGYYIEVTKPNLKLVPENYKHQQTLVNRTRFTTQELKDLELEIIKAENEINKVQQEAFDRVKKEVEHKLSELRQFAQALAYLDALFGLAKAAYDNNYTVPEISDDQSIIIEAGRHPVVELSTTSSFLPNDTNLTEQKSLWIMTGPNMAGKSTYLRQVAHLCIMTQVGSLIPARSASISIVDRIFSRIGSGDNLAEGKSTFLVEMEEAAVICTQATKNSLVVLDEVGRGTSTFDGMAIAQAIIEHIAQNIKAKCLFATHYHELTQLEKNLETIANYHMSVKKTSSGIIFLYKLAKGVASGSFGIQVAKLANLPDKVILRAKELLKTIHTSSGQNTQNAQVEYLNQELETLSKNLNQKDKIFSDIKAANLDEMSPRLALDFLFKIKEKIQKT